MCPNCGSYVSPGSPTCSCGTPIPGKMEEIEDPYEENKNEAKRLTEHGDYSEALECWDEALRYSSHCENIIGRAKTCYLAGMYEEALEGFSKCVEHYSYSGDLYYWCGRCHEMLGEFDDAIEDYQKSAYDLYRAFERDVERSGDSKSYWPQKYLEWRSNVHHFLGRTYRLKGDDENLKEAYLRSLEYLDRSIEVKHTPERLKQRAITIERLERFDESKSAYGQERTDIAIDSKARPKINWVKMLLEKNAKESAEEISQTDSEEIIIEYDYSPIKIESAYPKPAELEDTERERLITITGCQFYTPIRPFEKGDTLILKREPFDEYGSDEIGVYQEDVKVGHVSNSPDTSPGFTALACEIEEEDVLFCEYLMKFKDQYHIARII